MRRRRIITGSRLSASASGRSARAGIHKGVFMKRLAVFIIALACAAVISPAAPVPTAEAALGGIAVTSMSVYFENRRPEITVSRADTGLRATADIATTGSGPL